MLCVADKVLHNTPQSHTSMAAKRPCEAPPGQEDQFRVDAVPEELPNRNETPGDTPAKKEGSVFSLVTQLSRMQPLG